ncbi:hypothetical protein [Pseudomonas sp. REB1044]|uniref:RHS repeat domain-containing protein n=1 Tax=Pseudomonas sp. REB1044 TaxID=2675224 RepID=UPI00315D0CED
MFVRKQGTLHAQRLNFYGYAKLTPIQQPHVNRAHVLVPSRKLTIFEPAFERTDITELQLNIAKRWAKSYVDSLKAQLKASQDEEERSAFKEMMASLDRSLAWQSKQNSTGFKLKKPWAADAMQVEELLYETDKKKPGFGRVTTNTLYALDCEGAEIASTKVITSVTYSQPQGHPRALTRLVKVVSPENEPSVSSSTLSTLTNTLLNRVDAEGTDTQWTYDKTGCLTNVKSTRAGAVVHETTHTRTQLASGYLQHEVHETGTTLASRLTVDAQGRALETSITYDGKNWLLMASADYDDLGRQCATRIFDYDAGHQCLHQLETLYTFLQDQSGHTTTSRLKDAAENVLDSKSVDITYSAHSRKAVHGNFSYATRWDPVTGTLTEESGLDKANRGTLQINSVFDAQGRKTSIESRRLDVKNAALLSATQLSYSEDGLLAGVHRKAGGQSFEQTFEYDEHGRLIKQNENGLIIENRYSADNHSSFANEATLTRVSTDNNEKTSKPIVLGSQTVDALGQLHTRTVNGVVESFTASDDTPNDGSPPPLKAFSSTWDSATRTLDVLCPVSYELDGKIIESLNTRTLYSLRGQILKKKDIVGQTTAYTYDAFGRVTEQVNEVCKTTFTYQDDGLLSQECIEDVGKKRTLTVHYAYDALSNEVSRTFTCPGMATHVLSRTLSADGQLTSSTLKVGNDEHSSDRYVYDAHGRLIKWSGSGKHFMFHEGAMVEQVFDYDLLGNVTRTQYIEKIGGPALLDGALYSKDPTCRKSRGYCTNTALKRSRAIISAAG